MRDRTINQTGPVETAGLVCAKLAHQLARVEAGLQEPVLHGIYNGLAWRDFCDVRDVVETYWAALEFGQAGQAYNICSGQSLSITRICELLLARTALSDIALAQTQTASANGGIFSSQVDSLARLKSCSSWRPQIAFEDSLRDLLNAWHFKRVCERGD